MWDLIVSVPDHCLSFYYATTAVHICMFKMTVDKYENSVNVGKMWM